MKQEEFNWKQEEEFFLEFLGDSEELRDDGHTEEEMFEALENYLVIPPPQTPGANTPLSLRAALKDTESNQMVETWLSKIMLMTSGPNGFITASAVGREDAFKAEVVASLLETGFRRPGNYRSLYVGFKDTFLFGQTVLFPAWVTWYGMVPYVRTDGVDPFSGVEMVDRGMMPGLKQDDIQFLTIDLDDFYPYPGVDSMNEMLFAAHRYNLPNYQIEQYAEQGRWRKDKTKEALDHPGGRSPNAPRTGRSPYWPSSEAEDKSWRWSMDRTVYDRMSHTYRPGVAIEGWGEVPYTPRGKDKNRWRRMTLLNGRLVESRGVPYSMPRRVPYCDFVANPIKGRWRGVSPVVVGRYTQSAADALLICLMDAVIKQTNVPILVDENANIDVDQLAAWTGPIEAANVDGIREVSYKPQLGPAFQMYMHLKDMNQNTSGMRAGLQGEGLGSKRFSASEAVETFRQQLDRPTAMAALFENEGLPDLGRAMLELYQQFIPTSAELYRRVGASRMVRGNEVSLNDIDGQYDIFFDGSSRMAGREVQLQFLTQAMQMAAQIPGAAGYWPWIESFMKTLELMDLRDMEKLVGDNLNMEEYMANVQRAMGSANAEGNGNGNFSTPNAPPQPMRPVSRAG